MSVQQYDPRYNALSMISAEFHFAWLKFHWIIYAGILSVFEGHKPVSILLK